LIKFNFTAKQANHQQTQAKPNSTFLTKIRILSS